MRLPWIEHIGAALDRNQAAYARPFWQGGGYLTSSPPKGRGFLRRRALICGSLRRVPASSSGLTAPTLHRLQYIEQQQTPH
ncbi:MAG: hypothetical protein V7642_5282 [Burkholderiales bacterium]